MVAGLMAGVSVRFVAIGQVALRRMSWVGYRCLLNVEFGPFSSLRAAVPWVQRLIMHRYLIACGCLW